MKQKNSFFRQGAVFLMAVLLLAGCGKALPGSAKQNEKMETEPAPASFAENMEEAPEAPYNNGRMPEFSTKDLDGNTVTESIFAEKDLTVVNIWGTFCNPCIGEMPALGEWAGELPDNVQLVGLISDFSGEDDTEHHDLAVSIMEMAGADFLQIIANQDFTPLMKDIVGVPTTMFVDREGNIVGEPILGANVEGYKEFVEEYLDER